MPKIKILNSASAEEVAVIVAAVNTLANRAEKPEREAFTKWENLNRRCGYRNRNLWESKNNSLWYLEARNI